ncbi:MAG TPA: hypothetical protein VM680_07365 [Verrucomicrobiae bacterium]|nr:hypothetical protein [Verrucomicrobiae bacterium]
MKQNETPLFEQPFFRTIVISGAGLALAAMLGSLPLVKGRDASGFQWGWSAWSLVFIVCALIFNRSFWRCVFRASTDRSPQNKSKVVYHIFVLALLGVGSFLYPLRFLSEQHYFTVARGLFTAVLFLGGVGVLLFKLGQGLFANELKDGRSS